MTARVAGLGLWTPRAPSVDARRAGGLEAPAAEPAAALLGPRLRRRASLLSRLTCEALGQALTAAGADPAAVVMVLGSVRGELETTVALLDQLAQGEVLSPALFTNSVQNAALGLASIAAGNRAPSTTVAAGPATVAMALLEGLGLLAARGTDVAVVLADEPLPAPFAGEPGAPLAVALLLRAGGPGPGLRLVRRAASATAVDVVSPVAPALALVDALLVGGPAVVALEAGEDDVWCAEVSP